LLGMALPARRAPPPDELAREPVRAGLLGAVLGAAKVGVTLEPRREVAHACVRLAFAIRGVRRGAPPRRLDGPPPIWRDHEVDPFLVPPLPELPPGGRAAVRKVETNRGRNAEQLRGAHRVSVAASRYGPVRSREG